jgi:hypothetical protein
LWTIICPISGSGSSLTYCQPVCLSRLCLLKVHAEISSSPLPPSPVQWLVSCLPFQALFTESSHGDQLLTPPLFSGTLSALCTLCFSFSAPCLLFSFVVFWFFLQSGGQSVQGAMLVYPRGTAYLLTCWSVSPKRVWSWCLVVWEPSCFLSVMWCGEAVYRLGVQGVRVLILLGSFFLPSVSPASQQNF